MHITQPWKLLTQHRKNDKQKAIDQYDGRFVEIRWQSLIRQISMHCRQQIASGQDNRSSGKLDTKFR